MKKLYPNFKLDVLSTTNQMNTQNGISLKEDDLELKEKTEQPVLLSQVDEPPIQQTSFCEH